MSCSPGATKKVLASSFWRMIGLAMLRLSGGCGEEPGRLAPPFRFKRRGRLSLGVQQDKDVIPAVHQGFPAPILDLERQRWLSGGLNATGGEVHGQRTGGLKAH